ncbi:MAG: SsrA-binding protein SmpB [Acidimicrobiaceae bacterium]|nr:SsrA-binding protein SmpB [Acidimicrobiaceae bacterium]MYE97125.1 SsrA-binding protein SmpB [Acidimicrobiaceae bacterium]MYI55274.1 SsrA-binding protein SmpB [Acidimicrobiaceae bacterium]
MAKSQKRRDVPEGASVVSTNRRARRNYDVIETLEVGLVLQGSEVKSLREGNVQIAESWARIDQGELWLHNLHISPYSHSAASFRSEPDRVRKLLAHRREIQRLASRVDQERLALVPLALYFNEGKAKLALALARGRTRSDRRRDIQQRDADAEAARSMAAARRRRTPPPP